MPPMNIIVSSAILLKLNDRHKVSRREIEQCFDNVCGKYLEDTREDHKTDPATLWFVAPTNHDRLLKIIFIYADGNVHIKSAYEPSRAVIDIYEKFGK